MVLAIIGSRSFFDYEKLKDVLKNYLITKIVSGGAKGADSLAKQYALEHNIPIIEFLPDWDKFGKSAGPIRNQKIVNEAEFIIAFWDGKSKGTKQVIEYVKKKDKNVRVVLFDF